MKSSGEQYDDRIVEVHWDPSVSSWRWMRFRNDKPNGNYRDTVENIVQSIMDGVEKDTVSRAHRRLHGSDQCVAPASRAVQLHSHCVESTTAAGPSPAPAP